MTLTENARKFLDRKPTLIASVAGRRFYEHPTKGDESPLVEITREGKVRLSDFWEAPSLEDLI